jgi:ATP-dependent 26S proteasome regulatory subunit
VSKTKRKESSESEHFKGQIRKLESENRQLRKRIRALDKRSHLYDDLIEAVAEDIVIKEEKCKKCQVGVLQLVKVNHLKFLVCGECKDRKKL